MDLFDAIYTRRSVRKYEDKPIEPELLEELLKAAMFAPTAGNQQTWQFIVVTKREILNAVPEILPYGAMAAQAAAGILVCGDTAKEKHTQGYLPQDCAAATQNLLLAAHAKGLGAVWCGVHPRQDREEGFRKLLAIPESITPITFVCLGWPESGEKKVSVRFDPEKIHYNSW